MCITNHAEIVAAMDPEMPGNMTESAETHLLKTPPAAAESLRANWLKGD